MSGNGSRGSTSFLMGGLGCLSLFIVPGLITLLLGGTFYIDFAGMLFLFIVGGFLGAIILIIYDMGRASTKRKPSRQYRRNKKKSSRYYSLKK